jgi:hypothetical protein
MTENNVEPTPAKAPWYKQKKIIIPLVSLVVLISIVNSSSESENTPATESATSAPAEESQSAESPQPEPVAEEGGEYGVYPSDQKEFIDVIVAARTAIDNAETDLQESVALRKRDADLCKILSSNSAKNWVGVITNIGANGEGKAYVEIELADDVRVKTWNNAFSDLNDNTLIPTSASFFDRLVALTEDTKVIWSAKFLSDDDSCLKKANFTDVFYGIDPQFVVRFSDIKAG